MCHFSLAARSQSARLYLGGTCGGASSSRYLAARRRRGRSRRARSSRADAAHRRAHDHAADDAESQARVGAFLQGLRNWAGPRPQRADRHPLGREPMPAKFADTRRNWPRSRRTSFWPLAPRPWGRCYRRPARCRSCSRSSPIRSAPASSTAWRGRAATPPVLLFEYGMSAKWLELLKQIAPGVTRAAVLRDTTPSLRDRPVRRHPGRGAVARGGGEPGQHARRRRDRARRRRIRALAERRPDRGGERRQRRVIAI